MYIKQLSVFVENQSGKLAEISEIIGKEGIDIRAISIADTTDFGILRLIVDRPDDACTALKKNGLTVSLTEVIAVGIHDKPGEFARALRTLSDAEIEVEYMYAFISREDGDAYVILRIEDNDKAVSVLTSKGFRILEPELIYNM